MIQVGNTEYDKFKVRLKVAPNGMIDESPRWTNPEGTVLLEVSEDGKQCDITADTDVAAYSVTVTARADNSATPDVVEEVTETFVGSFSHSKADSMGGSFELIPRG